MPQKVSRPSVIVRGPQLHKQSSLSMRPILSAPRRASLAHSEFKGTSTQAEKLLFALSRPLGQFDCLSGCIKFSILPI